MSIIQVNHIRSNCKSRFEQLIDISDVHTMNAEDREVHFLSRALAAFCIAAIAKVDDQQAAESVVDESLDDVCTATSRNVSTKLTLSGIKADTGSVGGDSGRRGRHAQANIPACVWSLRAQTAHNLYKRIPAGIYPLTGRAVPIDSREEDLQCEGFASAP